MSAAGAAPGSLSPPKKLADLGIKIRQDGAVRSAFELLSFVSIKFDDLLDFWPDMKQIDKKVRKELIILAKYDSYLKRQDRDIEVFMRDENMKISKDIDYSKINSLSNEVRQKLDQIRPTTIGSALRISGVTPAAVMAVIVYLKKMTKL